MAVRDSERAVGESAPVQNRLDDQGVEVQLNIDLSGKDRGAQHFSEAAVLLHDQLTCPFVAVFISDNVWRLATRR